MTVVDKEKDLGVLQSKNLKFDEHIDKIVSNKRKHKQNRKSTKEGNKTSTISKTSFLWRMPQAVGLTKIGRQVKERRLD